MTYAAVVLPVPVNRSYIYEVPESLAARVVPGARVVVPLRQRSVVGIVTEVITQPPSAVSRVIRFVPSAASSAAPIAASTSSSIDQTG